MKKSLRRISCVLFCCCALIVPAYVARGAEEPKGLQIAPLRTRLAQKPGQVSTGQTTVTNRTREALTSALSVERFKTTDEDYHYDFSQGEHTDWVRLADSTVQLGVDEFKNVAYSLAVPADAAPGGYYFAIFAATTTGDGGTSIQETRRVASLIYLEVDGDLVRKVNLLGVDVPWFTTKPRVSVDSRLVNQGNTHVEAVLTSSVKPIIGYSREPTSQQGLILPGTVRRLTDTAKLSQFPGIYNVGIEYRSPEGTTQKFNQLVLYLPVWSWFVLASPFVLALVRWRLRRNTSQTPSRSVGQRYTPPK